MTCTEVGVCSDGKRGHFGGGFLVFCNGFVSLFSTGWALPSLHSYRHPSCFSCTLNQKNIYIRRSKNPDIILKARDVIYDILLHYKLCCMANWWSVSAPGAGMCPVVTAFHWWRFWWLGVGLAWTGGGWTLLHFISCSTVSLYGIWTVHMVWQPFSWPLYQLHVIPEMSARYLVSHGISRHMKWSR